MIFKFSPALVLAAACLLLAGLGPLWVDGVIFPLTMEERRLVTDLHNKFRSDLAQRRLFDNNKTSLPGASNMVELVYDSTLGSKAQEAADRCVKAHSTHASTYGENFMFTEPQPVRKTKAQALTDVLTAWANQYKNCSDLDLNKPFPENISCPEFTQMAWATSAQFGCGIRYCNAHREKLPSEYAVYCLYTPSGNNFKKPIYKVGDECEECAADHVCTDAGLCAGMLGQEDKGKPMPLNRRDMNYALNVHNEYRSQLARGRVQDFDSRLHPSAGNMVTMVYDSLLQQRAQEAAERCSSSVYAKYSQHGHNFYVGRVVGKTQQAILHEVLATWWSESERCSKLNLNLPYPGSDTSCYEHFTQMAWAESRRLGCGMSSCGGGVYSVYCLYGDPGNQEGQHVYEVGVACTKCPPQRLCDDNTGTCWAAKTGPLVNS